MKDLFANRLDALLLKYNVDLLKCQSECDIYLKKERDISSIEYWVGSRKLALKYLDDLYEDSSKSDKLSQNSFVTETINIEPQLEENLQTPQKMQKSEHKSNENETRQINEKELSAYFKPQFKGKGNGTINYFNQLIEDLKTDRTALEFAQIAYLIYQSDKLNDRKPKTFSKWSKMFCQCIGVAYSKSSYQPNKAKNPSESLKNLFSYLN